jgi:hypothetical protein
MTKSLESLVQAANYRGRRGRTYKSKLRKQMAKTFNDDSTFHHNDADGQVVLGVYGAEDWIAASWTKERYLAGEKTSQLNGTWITGTAFNLQAFAEEHFTHYVFFDANSVTGYTNDAMVKVMTSRNKIDAEISGDIGSTKEWATFFDTNFKKAESLIEWVYNSHGDDISVPLNYRPAIRTAYPWIDSSYVNITDYIDEYINSEASVLILIGPPGTGKTTFIKNLIHRSNSNAKVTYDPKIMMDDGFFAGFIDDETRFLIMEDADEFLQSRVEGNTMMHKFLNVSDGLISAADKKMVFSTNLPNVADIDEALMRPGRCFDVMQFRALTRDEAKAVQAEVGHTGELPDGKEITLAEIFSAQPSGKTFVRRKMGFVS